MRYDLHIIRETKFSQNFLLQLIIERLCFGNLCNHYITPAVSQISQNSVDEKLMYMKYTEMQVEHCIGTCILYMYMCMDVCILSAWPQFSKSSVIIMTVL